MVAPCLSVPKVPRYLRLLVLVWNSYSFQGFQSFRQLLKRVPKVHARFYTESLQLFQPAGGWSISVDSCVGAYQRMVNNVIDWSLSIVWHSSWANFHCPFPQSLFQIYPCISFRGEDCVFSVYCVVVETNPSAFLSCSKTFTI